MGVRHRRLTWRRRSSFSPQTKNGRIGPASFRRTSSKKLSASGFFAPEHQSRGSVPHYRLCTESVSVCCLVVVSWRLWQIESDWLKSWRRSCTPVDMITSTDYYAKKQPILVKLILWCRWCHDTRQLAASLARVTPWASYFHCDRLVSVCGRFNDRNSAAKWVNKQIPLPPSRRAQHRQQVQRSHLASTENCQLHWRWPSAERSSPATATAAYSIHWQN